MQWGTYGTVEQVRVASNLAKLQQGIEVSHWTYGGMIVNPHLHDDVHQAILILLLAGQAVDSLDILFQHRPIPLALHVRETDVNVDFLF